MSFFNELKRRNVVRVAIAYAVASWVLLQIADLLLENIAAPPWVIQVMMLVILLGFIASVVIAWAYELTPQGVKRQADVDLDHSITAATGHKLDRIIIGFLALAVVYFVYDKSTTSQLSPAEPASLVAEETAGASEPDAKPDTEPSIAVLPFVNMSPDADQEFFSDGISEELLNLLVKVKGLKVASRTSSFNYKGSDLNLADIAGELHVDHVLEGSVRKSDNRVRITAQLIDADNDRHLWSDSYDRELTDIFQIQEDIANAIVTALTAELGIGLQVVDIGPVTSNISAYDLYLEARELFIARKNLPKSWRLLEQARDLDPQFARAWEALAAVHSVATSWLPGDGIDHESLALAAAYKALEIDPDLSMAYAVIGMKHETTGEGYAGAIRNLNKAIENNSKNATAWLFRGVTQIDMGYTREAVVDLEQCLSIDAGYLNCSHYLALSLLALGETEAAIKQFESTIGKNFHSMDGFFVSYYVHTGQRKLALLVATNAMPTPFTPIKDWIEAIENPHEDQSSRVARFNKWGTEYDLDICDMDAIAIALQQEQCFPTIKNAFLMWQPDTADFRKKPAFKEFVNTHLMEYWSQYGFPPQCRSLENGDFECD